MNIQPHEIIGALAALGVYPPARILVKRAVLANDIAGPSDSTPMPITWDTGDFDPLNPTRIYVPSGFSYALVSGMARVSGSGSTDIYMWHNGNTVRNIGFNNASTATDVTASTCAQMWPVSGGDYFELVVRRGTSLTDIFSYGSHTSFSLTLFP